MAYMNNYGYEYEPMVDMSDNNIYDDRQVSMGPTPGVGYPQMGPVTTPPIIEPGRERVINRCMVHEVPHVCPINTRIINNHIYRHTYCPAYTCCEQNVVSQVYEGCCGQFR